jgi:hypothetical protein
VFKNRKSYIVEIVIASLMTAWFLCMPLMYGAVKAIVPFPRLEEATYLEGTFDYEGEWPYVLVPRYYVVNSKGRHEFYCGYFSQRQACFTGSPRYRGAPIKVWTNYWYGRLQYELSLDPKNMRAQDDSSRSYSDARSWFYDSRNSSNYRWSFPVILLMFVFLYFFIDKQLTLRSKQKSKYFYKNMED